MNNQKDLKVNLAAAKAAHKAGRKFYQKKRFYLGLVVAFIFIGSMAGGSDGDTAAPGSEIKTAVVDVAKDTATAAEPVEVAAEPVSEGYKIGETVQLKNIKVKVNKFINIKGSEYNLPTDGNEWVGADITIENTSDKDQAISSIMLFKIVDQEGRSQEMSIGGSMAANAGQLDGKLAAGRKMSGVYAVEVKKGTTGLELEFLSGIFGTEQIVIKLN